MPTDRHLLMIAFHYPPDNTSTGVLRTLKFSEYLLRQGWRSHVISVAEHVYANRDAASVAAVPSGVTVERTWACDIKRAVGVRGIYPGWLAVPDRYWPWLFSGTRAGARAIRRMPIDAVYSTFPQPTAHLIGLRLKRRFGLPWIADFRDPWIEDSIPRWRRRIEQPMERAVIRNADRVICNTPAMRRQLMASYPAEPGSKFVTICNGYDEADIARIVPERVGAFNIVYPGEINDVNRNPRGLLRGVRYALDRGWLRDDDLRLTFVGAGPYGKSRQFTKDLADSRLEPFVELICERLPYATALAKTAGADVLVVLSENLQGAGGEGIRSYTLQQVPAKVYEYLRMGQPVLALVSEGAVKELLEETAAGDAIAPFETECVAKALGRYYAQARNRAGVEPRARASIEMYSRENLTKLLARELDTLVAEHASRRAVNAQPTSP